jgi:hypothetical protein
MMNMPSVTKSISWSSGMSSVSGSVSASARTGSSGTLPGSTSECNTISESGAVLGTSRPFSSDRGRRAPRRIGGAKKGPDKKEIRKRERKRRKATEEESKEKESRRC